jgi:hypothetical protein
MATSAAYSEDTGAAQSMEFRVGEHYHGRRRMADYELSVTKSQGGTLDDDSRPNGLGKPSEDVKKFCRVGSQSRRL